MRVPRGCDVARNATWQSHASPREHLRGAEVTRGQYLYLPYIVYNIYRSPDYRETKLLTIITASPYIPENFILFLPCGTKSHTVYLSAGDVAASQASDQGRDVDLASIAWIGGPPIIDRARVI